MKKVKEMPYHIGFKVKIYPSNEQKHLIAVNDGAAKGFSQCPYRYRKTTGRKIWCENRNGKYYLF